jgi:hypothetical protein
VHDIIASCPVLPHLAAAAVSSATWCLQATYSAA